MLTYRGSERSTCHLSSGRSGGDSRFGPRWAEPAVFSFSPSPLHGAQTGVPSNRDSSPTSHGDSHFVNAARRSFRRRSRCRAPRQLTHWRVPTGATRVAPFGQGGFVPSRAQRIRAHGAPIGRVFTGRYNMPRDQSARTCPHSSSDNQSTLSRSTHLMRFASIGR